MDVNPKVRITFDTAVLVNYTRKALGQTGGGHISPLGAYDEARHGRPGALGLGRPT